MPTAFRPHLGIAGLHTDPNPHVAIPEGALVQADECVIRRVGTAECRPGFKVDSTDTPLDYLQGMLPFASGKLHVGPTDGTSTTYWNNTTPVEDEDGNALQWDVDHIRGQEARGNLYITTSDGIRKYQAAEDDTAFRAGLLPPEMFYAKIVSGSGTNLPDGNSISYRATIEREDANGVITRSLSSSRVVVRNEDGATRNVELQFGWRGAQPGDTIKIWRSRRTTSEVPADEHFLVHTATVSVATDVGNILVDPIEESRLYGEALYTNPSREGPEGGNFRPPACKDLAHYQSALFYAGVTGYARKTLSRLEGGLITGEGAGIGRRLINCTATNGSSVLTSVDEMAGLEVGMLMENGAGWPSGPTRIVSMNLGANTITMSGEWEGSTGSESFVLADSIKIGSQYFVAWEAGHLIEFINHGSADLEGDQDQCTVAFAYGIGTTTEHLDTNHVTGKRTTFVIEALSALDSFTVSASHGDEYEPKIPLHTQTAETVSPDDLTGYVAHSKADQPDHYLLSSYYAVGITSVPVLRSFATRDAIWLLKGKGDGIYRLSGFGVASGFRIDQFDPSTYLLHPNLACVLDDQVYAWTNRGMVCISDGGIRVLSTPIASDTRPIETLLDHSVTEPGAFAVGNPKAGEVIFGLPSNSMSGPGTGTGRIYCYNTRSNAWTRWFASSDQFTCAAYRTDNRRLCFGRDNEGAARVERLETDGLYQMDREFSINVTSMTGTTGVITVSSGSGWNPDLGDLVTFGSITGLVVEETSVTNVTLVRTNTNVATGSGTAYESIPCVIKWHHKAADAPHENKRWQELMLHFEEAEGLYRWFLGLSSTTNMTPTELTYSRSSFNYDSTALDHRSLVPRDHAVASRLHPSISIAQAGSRWRLSGMTLGYSPIGSSKVTR